MTPYEAVREEFEFPFDLYPFQIEEVNELCSFNRVGFYWRPGAGKTAGSTYFALYHTLTSGIRHWLVPMPPILCHQWGRWLSKVRDKRTGLPVTYTVYEGPPAKRLKLNLDVQFVLTSYGLLKNDAEHFEAFYTRRRMGVVIDEGHAIKNIASENHKVVRRLAADRPLAVLTGTPLTKPIDAYAYVKLIAPHVYKNLHQFELLHVKETDQYGTVVQWNNLDLLAKNMKIQTSRITREVLKDQLPPVTFSTMHYDLDPAHLKLYNRIADEKLVEFEDGREINAISTQALYSALQQMVINWGFFEDDETREPAAIKLIEEVLDELGPDAKLAVVANFVRSNTYLLDKLKKYHAVAIYGLIPPAGKQAAIKRFIDDPICRIIILQPSSAGFGVDGLQHVCSDMLILEAPTTAPPFEQVCLRLDRDGQKDPVHCRIGIARKTVQVRMFHNLLDNDAMINSVQGGYKDLRDAIHGG